ncbi:PTS sugar transporter subunit IIA [Alkalibacterium putridalgicola]|uniref:PTS sugar transporter subunit IIA n=1 Tax=Alkalibacterium putridalgicola TaxID=426703 RepID=UPI0034CF8FF9
MIKNQLFKKHLSSWTIESQNELFRKFADYCQTHDIVHSSGILLEELFQRESQGSSLIDEGFALPHVESSNVIKSAVILIRLDEPIVEWNHKDQFVKGVLFLVLKKGETTENLVEIREIMKMLADETVIAGLLNGNQKIVNKLF